MLGPRILGTSFREGERGSVKYDLGKKRGIGLRSDPYIGQNLFGKWCKKRGRGIFGWPGD